MLKPLLTLALLLPAITHARIGETPEECAKRYGLPAERLGTSETPILKFQKAGVITSCYFTGGMCTAICFEIMAPVRADLQHSEQNTVSFTAEQIAALLAANKGDSEWKSFLKDGEINMYHTKDSQRQAIAFGTHVIIQDTLNIAARKGLVTPTAITEAIKGF